MKKNNSKQIQTDPHYYVNGSEILKAMSSFGTSGLDPTQIAQLGQASGALAGANNFITGGNNSIAGNIMSTAGSAISTLNPVIGLGVQGAGILTNLMFGSNPNETAFSQAEAAIKNSKVNYNNATSYEQLAQMQNSAPSVNLNDYDFGTEGWFSNKVTNRVNDLKDKIAQQNVAQQNSFNTAVDNIAIDRNRDAMNNISALGGKIHIKEKNKGKFTEAAKRRGLGVQEFASKVLANKENYSSTVIKRAVFAKNASKWHADGGDLMNSIFTNGVTEVNTGSTHELNPNGGVPMGIAPDGLNNLVEQGETIYNDYVFSDRLQVPEYIKKRYHLNDNVKTFSDAFKQLEKESKERPNDPISKNGLEAIFEDLMNAQEAVRMKMKDNNNKYSLGGRKFALGDWITDYFKPNYGIGNYNIVVPEYNIPQFSNIDYSKLPEDTVVPNDKNSSVPNTRNNNIEPLPKIIIDDTVFLKKALNDLVAQTNQSQSIKVPVKPKKTRTNSFNDNFQNGNLSWLRLAEPLANVAAVTSDLLGKTNTATTYDYIPEYQDISYKPLSGYLTYDPLDVNYAINKAAAQSAATRRALANSAAPNRDALLIAQDYNTLNSFGDLYRQAIESNRTERQRIADFNKSIDLANSQMALQAAQANATNRLNYAQSRLQQAKFNDESSNLATASRWANIGNLATSIANLGREADTQRNVRTVGPYMAGTMSAEFMKSQNFPKAAIYEILKARGMSDEDAKKEAGYTANGGKIYRKKKRGLTY